MISIDAAMVPFQLNTSMGASHMVQVREGDPNSPMDLSGTRVRLASGKDGRWLMAANPTRSSSSRRAGRSRAPKRRWNLHGRAERTAARSRAEGPT